MTPLTLHQYRVDRATIATPTGLEQGVVLVLVDNDRHEYPFVLSAVDAKLIAGAMSKAADEAQEAKRRELG